MKIRFNHFLWIIVAVFVKVADVWGQPVADGSIEGYEHYDILKHGVDLHPLSINSIAEYEAKVINRE